MVFGVEPFECLQGLFSKVPMDRQGQSMGVYGVYLAGASFKGQGDCTQAFRVLSFQGRRSLIQWSS